MPEELISLTEMKSLVLDIKKHLNNHCERVAFLPQSTDFYELISVRAELKELIIVSTKLFEDWIKRQIEC